MAEYDPHSLDKLVGISEKSKGFDIFTGLYAATIQVKFDELEKGEWKPKSNVHTDSFVNIDLAKQWTNQITKDAKDMYCGPGYRSLKTESLFAKIYESKSETGVQWVKID